ncbi:MAG: dihydroorotate dehydrogenase, partial [Planctomycetaceae bacterium]|nr:dihydroorotate dehydrogenase [Planctomycetaceae bacterium]
MTRVPRLAVVLNRLQLASPILVASGTFGYAREMADFTDFSSLGAVIPKTVTARPRIGNPPPRTVETASGLLNAIGLDNDGLAVFITEHLPYLAELPTAIIANIAGHSLEEFQQMAETLDATQGLSGLELNISCPNVSGGIDFGTNPTMAGQVVERVRQATSLPVIAKLTPNVTDIVAVA